MPVLLMIVAHDRPMLYAELCHEFDGDESVSVVLDRRQGERRHQPQAVTEDQRRADRRQIRTDSDLRRLGWATVPTA